MDLAMVKELAGEATQLCIKEFDQIDQGLPSCCRCKPEEDLTEKDQKAYLRMIAEVRETQKTTYYISHSISS